VVRDHGLLESAGARRRPSWFGRDGRTRTLDDKGRATFCIRWHRNIPSLNGQPKAPQAGGVDRLLRRQNGPPGGTLNKRRGPYDLVPTAVA